MDYLLSLAGETQFLWEVTENHTVPTAEILSVALCYWL